MAKLLIHTDKIKENIKNLGQYFNTKKIEWSLITKVFSGDRVFLKKILDDEIIDLLHSIGDSRLTSLKNLKSVNKDIRTIYIKPPAEVYASEVVRYADISLNSSFKTIQKLNQAALRQNKVHQVIIMIELGELREGVNREDILNFYRKVFDLSNVEVIGLGSNLGCMYGVEPTYDKLLHLSLYKELISSKFSKDLPYVSGGTSITLPLIEDERIPPEINHFRIGEAAFFGISPIDGKRFKNLHTDAFEFYANIIELHEKKVVPEGTIGEANIGHTSDFDEADRAETSYKVILDFGLLDVNREDIDLEDPDVSFVGITSDMLVLDVGENRNKDGSIKYVVGDKIKFDINYMAVARLLNSKFIDKIYS